MMVTGLVIKLSNGRNEIIRVYSGKLGFYNRSGGEVQNIKCVCQILSKERVLTCKR